MSERPAKKTRYYDVEAFHRVYTETLRTHAGLRRSLGRVTRFFDSMEGFFVAMLAPLIGFGTFLGVIVGSIYGPIAFIVIFGGVIGGLGYVAEKRVGRALRFGDVSLFRSAFAQVIAFLILLGIILAAIAASRSNLLGF